MGWNDRLDVIEWINYIAERNPESKIILHGVSMGAATTMMATGEKLPENVKAGNRRLWVHLRLGYIRNKAYQEH